jgi:2-C-methyl-D-erythritol 2,4-cyclodiphosphate synthase
MLRIGLGHDTHRLTDGNGMIIGGVKIPYHRSLHGHSDADVLLHALTDALLGAAGFGDIGELFPDTDPANKGRDSAEMLSIVWQKVQQNGWQIVNSDMIVFAQRPKLSPHKEEIKTRIAELLSVETEQIGLKAKTGENIGFIGRGEGISAQCVILLEKK